METEVVLALAYTSFLAVLATGIELAIGRKAPSRGRSAWPRWEADWHRIAFARLLLVLSAFILFVAFVRQWGEWTSIPPALALGVVVLLALRPARA